MELIYKGKTKDVYKIDEETYQLKFKDNVTGEDGVFDPGSNTVGLTIKGAGKAGLALTKYFYEKLNDMGISTHYISSDLVNNTMTVKKAETFGEGLEVICRYNAYGSFYRRYRKYAEKGKPFKKPFVEITIKDDEMSDPPITEDALIELDLLSAEEYKILKDLTIKISDFIKDELKAKNMDLYDIKLEFGRVGKNRQIALIDEISGGNMRAFRNGKHVSPLELEKNIL